MWNLNADFTLLKWKFVQSFRTLIGRKHCARVLLIGWTNTFVNGMTE